MTKTLRVRVTYKVCMRAAVVVQRVIYAWKHFWGLYLLRRKVKKSRKTNTSSTICIKKNQFLSSSSSKHTDDYFASMERTGISKNLASKGAKKVSVVELPKRSRDACAERRYFPGVLMVYLHKLLKNVHLCSLAKDVLFGRNILKSCTVSENILPSMFTYVFRERQHYRSISAPCSRRAGGFTTSVKNAKKVVGDIVSSNETTEPCESLFSRKGARLHQWQLWFGRGMIVVTIQSGFAVKQGVWQLCEIFLQVDTVVPVPKTEFGLVTFNDHNTQEGSLFWYSSDPFSKCWM